MVSKNVVLLLFLCFHSLYDFEKVDIHEAKYSSMSVCLPIDDLDLNSRSQLRIKLDNCLTCSLIKNIFKKKTCSLIIKSRTMRKLWHAKFGMTVDVCMAYIMLMPLFDDLDFDAKSQWVGKGNNSALLNYLDN